MRPLLLFCQFLALGFVINTICVGAWSVSNIVWVDFLHDNPNRTHGNALTMLALTPFYGGFGALYGSFLPVLTGALGAGIGTRFFGRIPLWYLGLLVPICGAAELLQCLHFYIIEMSDFRDSPLQIFATLSLFQLPSLIGCWLWTEWRRKRLGGDQQVVAVG